MKTLNMRFLFFSFLFLFIANTAFAQSSTFSYNGHLIELDKRVVEHYGQEYITSLKESNPDLLLYLNYFVINGYRLEDIGMKTSEYKIPLVKDLSRSEKSKAPAFNPSEPSGFNILSYNIHLTSEQQVYLTGNGSLAIIIPAKQSFLEKYNAYRNPLLN
jgi:hypothetical protein